MRKAFMLLLTGGLCLKCFSQSVIVSSQPTLNDRFSKRMGNLRLSSTIFKMGRIKNNAAASDTVRILNDGQKEMTLSFRKVPAFITVTPGTTILLPKSESWIAISYDVTKKHDFGFVLDRFELVTNDTLQPVKPMSVTANIQEFFPVMNAADSAETQKGLWTETVYDYGKVKQGSKVTRVFTLTNEGRRVLNVHRIRSACSCVTSTISADTIAPGAAVSITLTFDTTGKEGMDSRRITVYLNDPFKPEVILELKGQIEK